VLHQIDINTLHRIDSASLSGNEIGKVRIHTQEPLCFDVYQKNRNTGSFIIIDPVSMNTIAAGMIIRKTAAQVPPKSGNNTIYVPDILSEQKFRANKEGAVIWFTGLSGSGKTTLAEALQKRLRFMNIDCEHLDGDMMRECLSKDLGFSKHDRDINIERAAYIARLLAAHGVVVLASFISPYSKHRELARREVANFIEIYVDTPLPVCEERDVKGLYKKARLGEITDFTGINDPYEVPKSPEITISTAASTPDVAVGIIMDYLRNQGLI
jgi:bifunctional enzyme CysN/CysC